tara:strand:- start:3095 stop:3376 length:282 start_codon:yes stop_codon:yes gene_type:complete
MLLAAACFARSSERFFRWILDHPQFGTLVRRYRAGKGITLKIKLLGSSVSAFFVTFAVFFAMPQHMLWPRVFTGFAGLLGVLFILTRPTDRGD